MKCQFELGFNDYQQYTTSKLTDNKTIVSWSNLLEKVISGSKVKGCTFNHIAEMHFITIAKKLDMTYDFYIKHIKCALDWKLNVMINQDKSFINELPLNWAHPLNRKFESCCV